MDLDAKAAGGFARGCSVVVVVAISSVLLFQGSSSSFVWPAAGTSLEEFGCSDIFLTASETIVESQMFARGSDGTTTDEHETVHGNHKAQ